MAEKPLTITQYRDFTVLSAAGGRVKVVLCRGCGHFCERKKKHCCLCLKRSRGQRCRICTAFGP
jgi:hypothetical protein